MTSPSPTRRSISAEDEITLVLLLPFLLITFAGSVSLSVSSWLIEHRILAPAPHALIHLPGGAGADGPRLRILLGVFLLLIAVHGRRVHRSTGTQPPATAP